MFIGFQVDVPYSKVEGRFDGSPMSQLADGKGVGIDWTSSNLNQSWFGGSRFIPTRHLLWRRLAQIDCRWIDAGIHFVMLTHPVRGEFDEAAIHCRICSASCLPPSSAEGSRRLRACAGNSRGSCSRPLTPAAFGCDARAPNGLLLLGFLPRGGSALSYGCRHEEDQGSRQEMAQNYADLNKISGTSRTQGRSTTKQ